jgi:hypothetical protein
MKKELFALFCVLTMMASTAPIFAVEPTTPKTVTLDQKQIDQLALDQKKLTCLINKIETLKIRYKNKKKAKGILIALNNYEKQAKKLQTAITNYQNNPTAPAKIKIKVFNHKVQQLQWKVALKKKLLKKLNKPKT